MSDFQHRMQIELPAPSKIFTPAVIVSMLLLVLGFAATSYLTEFVAHNFALSTPGIFSGKVWQLFTYPFVEINPWNVVFGLWVILFAGSAVERHWGARGYALLWLVVTVACGLLWVLVTMALGRPYVGAGISVSAYALIAVFGILYRGVRFYAWFFTIEGQYVALILIGIGLVLSIPQPIALVWVGGALVAYLYTRLRWKAVNRTQRSRRASQGPGGFVDID